MPDRRTAAIHESAHAVLAVVLASPRQMLEVQIVHGHVGWFGQLVWAEHYDSFDRFSSPMLHDEALVTAAGRCAHERFKADLEPAISDEWCRDDDAWLHQASRAANGAERFDIALQAGATSEALQDAFDEDNAAWASWQRAIREEADGLVERYWSAILAVADGLESTPVEPVEVVNQETGEARMADSHRLLAGQVSELVIRTEADIR